MTVVVQKQKEKDSRNTDLFKINSFSHVELWVGNARQAAYFFKHGFGMDLIAYSGLETGNRKYASYVLQQNDIQLVVTSPYHPDEIAAHQLMHGDGAKYVGIEVDNATEAYRISTQNGALGIRPPTVLEDQYGKVVIADIQIYGDSVHRYVERKNYKGPFLPGYQERKSRTDGKAVGLIEIDHIVGNVEVSKMEYWANFYNRVMGLQKFIEFSEKDIATQFSALKSVVVRNQTSRIKMPINEPAAGLKKSQIEEYLEYYRGAGVQHVALRTDNILNAIENMRERDVEFMRVPKSYYKDFDSRIGKIDEDPKEVEELGILADKDADGYLLQLFTRNLQDRPTVFFEVIQRKGCQGFGKGNFKALFEAIEREQAERGNL